MNTKRLNIYFAILNQFISFDKFVQLFSICDSVWTFNIRINVQNGMLIMNATYRRIGQSRQSWKFSVDVDNSLVFG
jgi:hypothetical protein